MLATGFLLLSGMLGACTSYDYDEEMNNRRREDKGRNHSSHPEPAHGTDAEHRDHEPACGRQAE